mmetsp:Transcript_8789/g.23039  ORF Transcript_8789/g.23039 Transcript_8789/m.23039 type:complete len:319 (-) Transcript_8789:51-1007(-)
MENYKRVGRKTLYGEGETAAGGASKAENAPETIVVMPGGRVRSYISAAQKALATDEGRARGVVLAATGKTISKAISVAELLKRLGGVSADPDNSAARTDLNAGAIVAASDAKESEPAVIYQMTTVCSARVIDSWEPLIGGLDAMETERTLPCLRILLTLNPALLDAAAPGFQKSDYRVDARDRDLITSTVAALDAADGVGGSPGPNDSRRKGQRRDRTRRRKNGNAEGPEPSAGKTRAQASRVAATGETATKAIDETVNHDGQANSANTADGTKKNSAALRRRNKNRGKRASAQGASSKNAGQLDVAGEGSAAPNQDN